MRYKRRSSNPRRYRRRAGHHRRNPQALAKAHNPRPARRAGRALARLRHYVRRRHRRNPPVIAGLKLTEILYCGSAVILAPFLENQIRPLLPVTMQTGATGRWAVKVGAAAATWQAWRYVFGRHIGDLTGLVLGANLLSDAATEFMPSLTAGSGVAGYLNMPARRAALGAGGTPFMGRRMFALSPARGPLDPTY